MSSHLFGDVSQPAIFGRLSHELQIFPTPWHRYVHGLGLGPEPTGFKASKAARLLDISRVLERTTGSPYHAQAHQLLQGIVATCEAMATGGNESSQRGQAALASAVGHLAQLSDPWQYARACAMLIESLVKLGRLEIYQDKLRQALTAALRHVKALSPPTDKDRYERLQLFANLFLAAGQAGWTDLLMAPAQHGTTYIDTALRGIDAISEVFYHGRGAASLFTALGVVGCEEHICDGPQDHLRSLLDVFCAQVEPPPVQTSSEHKEGYYDPVHSFADLFMFPLSLTLNAIAVLDRPAYLEYRQQWIQQAVSLFQQLPAASRASQVIFYVFALSNLGVLNKHVPDMGACLHDCIAGFLQSTDGTQVDDYLRCTYLVHLAWQLGRFDMLPARVWDTLLDSLPRIAGTDLYLQSPYGSSYMVAAYTLSALDVGGRFEDLFGEKVNLLDTLGRFKDDAKTTATTLPRLDFALIDTALRLRPTNVGDTPLFRTVQLGQCG
jgi:hypothetical protein